MREGCRGWNGAPAHSMDIIRSDLTPVNVLLKSAQATPSDPRGFTCKARVPWSYSPAVNKKIHQVMMS